MLTFKKNWLYNYNKWCTGNWVAMPNVHEAKTLCGYFWGSIWNMFIVNLIYLIIFHVAGLICSLPLAVTGMVDKFTVFEKGSWEYFYLIVFSGYITVICLGLLGIISVFILSFLTPLLGKFKLKRRLKQNLMLL